MIKDQKIIAGSVTYTSEWGYNPADMVRWMKYPDGNTGAVGEQVNFEYNPQMALKRVAGTATYLDEAAYDEMGRMVTRKLGSLPETTYTYYPNGNILSIDDERPDDPNLPEDTDGLLTFEYDEANRLDLMEKNGDSIDDPAYDANGRLA